MFGKRNKTPPRIHLDYAAATPVHEEVLKVMMPYFNEQWANPSSIYREGVAARQVIEAARAELARLLHVRPTDVTFTSGGTEANNLAIAGLVESAVVGGKSYNELSIVTTALEHPSILEMLKLYEQRGVTIRYVRVTEEGCVDSDDLERNLTEHTLLVTVAYVNSEIGVIQPIKHIARLVKAYNAAHGTRIAVHTDASQAPLWCPCELDRLGVDMMTLDAGKCYGPKGAGVLVHRPGVVLEPLIRGGDQELGMRAGTENTALIVGMVRAFVRAQADWEARSERVALLREYFFSLIAKNFPAARINGSRHERVANNVNISLPGIDTEYAVIALDAAGIAASTKSACGGARGGGSAVVRAMTGDSERAATTLRFTLGEETTNADIEAAISALKAHHALMHNWSKPTQEAKFD